MWSHAILKGWRVHHRPKHTVPMSRAHARVFAIFLVAAGVEALAIGLLLQRELGLRPSEMLGLRKNDISFPEHRRESSYVAIVALGVRFGTKAKRPQAVVLRDPPTIGLLRYLCSRVGDGEVLIRVSYTTYRRILTKIKKHIGFPFQ